ncbi:MAG: velvet factor [Piptocephalis tieghemiana]|nr:MAG: velvet factor [Piptocephalis tieghemiana]
MNPSSASPQNLLDSDFELSIRQQPRQARMCGFGERDRRPIDPPPIIELRVRSPDPHAPSQFLPPFQGLNFMLHAQLVSVSKPNRSLDLLAPVAGDGADELVTVLMGSQVASPIYCKDTAMQDGCFFIFPDLSVRTEGRYRLRFVLGQLCLNSDPGGDPSRVSHAIRAECFSDPFTVYAAKKFPGMTDSTDLTKCFARQGVKVMVRKARTSESTRETAT